MVHSGAWGWRTRRTLSWVYFRCGGNVSFLSYGSVFSARTLQPAASSSNAFFTDWSFACAALCLASAALCRHMSAHDGLPLVRCIGGTRLVCPVFALYANAPDLGRRLLRLRRQRPCSRAAEQRG